MYRAELSHFRLNVRDLETAIEFYRRILRLEISERLGEEYAFLTNGERHHMLALQRCEPVASAHGSAGVDHIAFQVSDKRALAHAYQALADAGIPVRSIDNAISWSLYFADPEGNPLEIFCDTRMEAHGARQWQGVRRPLSAEEILRAVKSNQ